MKIFLIISSIFLVQFSYGLSDTPLRIILRKSEGEIESLFNTRNKNEAETANLIRRAIELYPEQQFYMLVYDSITLEEATALENVLFALGARNYKIWYYHSKKKDIELVTLIGSSKRYDNFDSNSFFLAGMVEDVLLSKEYIEYIEEKSLIPEPHFLDPVEDKLLSNDPWNIVVGLKEWRKYISNKTVQSTP